MAYYFCWVYCARGIIRIVFRCGRVFPYACGGLCRLMGYGKIDKCGLLNFEINLLLIYGLHSGSTAPAAAPETMEPATIRALPPLFVLAAVFPSRNTAVARCRQARIAVETPESVSLTRKMQMICNIASV